MEDIKKYELNRAINGMLADVLEWSMLIYEIWDGKPDNAKAAIRDMVKHYRGENLRHN